MVFGFLGRSWSEYLTTSDAGSFIPVARALARLEPADHLKFYDTRVFPGWPLLIAPLLGAGLPEPSVLMLVLLCAAFAPWLYLRLTGDPTGAWLLAVFPPAWLLATIHPISEGAYIVLIIAGCLAVRDHRWFLAGIAAGSLVLFRPFGLTWVLAFALPLSATPRTGRSAAAYVLGGALMAAVLAGTNLMLYGDLLHQFRVYARPLSELNLPESLSRGESPAGHWGWPFVNLVSTPFRYHVPLWKVAYIYTIAVASLALAGLAGRQLYRRQNLSDWERAALAGFLGNTLLSFCTGPYWGFYSFDRYFVWSLPGALIAARPWWQLWPTLPWILGSGSLAVTVFGVWLRFR